MSSSNYWFLTCIQVSQEAGQVVCYSHLSEFSTVYCVPQSQSLWHSQQSRNRCFSRTLAFFMIQRMLAIWSLIPLPFLKPAWISGSSWFTVHVLLKPGLENFQHYFISVWDECNCVVVWAFFCIAFLWNWNENGPFLVLWPLLNLPNLLAYWVQHFHSIIFQDLK